jgi:hypothetical protein
MSHNYIAEIPRAAFGTQEEWRAYLMEHPEPSPCLVCGSTHDHDAGEQPDGRLA